MAEQKILISIQINDRETANTNRALKVTKKNFDSLTKAEKEAIIADKQLALSAKQLDKELTAKAAAANAAADATGKMSATSGLNNAILMETSRLASDASYGFTAIANNLSQLVNLMQAQVQATGSLSATFRRLISVQSLLLIGVQLLITYGDDLYRAFERMQGISRLLRDSFKDAGSQVEDTAGSFELYISKIQDANTSQDEQKKAIELLKKEFPDFIKQLDEAKVELADVANETEEATKQLDLYRESIVKTALSEAARNAIVEESSKQVQAEANLVSTLNEKYGTTVEAAEALKKTRDEEIAAADTEGRIGRNRLSRLTETEKAIIKLVKARDKDVESSKKNIDVLKEFVQLGTGLDSGGGSPRERDFKQQLLDLSKLEESYRQKSIDQTLLTEDEKINLQEKFAKKELDIRLQQFKDRQKLRLDEFLESKASDTEKEQARKDYNESIELAEKEHNKVMIQLESSFNTERSKLTRKRAEQSADDIQKARDINRKTQEQALEDLRTFDNEANTLYFEANASFIESLMQRQQAIIDSEHSTIDQIASAQKEYFELQRQLRENDLNAEIAVIEAKKAVNLEYTGFAQSIGTILGNLAGENEALAKAALVVEKGAAIAKVIITAQSSIATRTASANAIPAFLPPFGAPNPAAFVAQAEAVKANTRTKIGAALSIATILSTAIGKKGGGAKDTGGGGGGRVIEAPDFNVVGASQTQQLAETVAGQQAKPVKAFVVGKDISTQQELDRNITNTASFG